MSDEQERLKRLRDRQLNDRDPLVKQKQFQRMSAQKEQKVKSKKTSIWEEWSTIPHVYRNPIVGILIGLGVILALPMLWDSSWAFWVGVIVTVLLIVMGIVIGQALDLRDSIKDSIKH